MIEFNTIGLEASRLTNRRAVQLPSYDTIGQTQGNG